MALNVRWILNMLKAFEIQTLWNVIAAFVISLSRNSSSSSIVGFWGSHLILSVFPTWPIFARCVGSATDYLVSLRMRVVARSAVMLAFVIDWSLCLDVSHFVATLSLIFYGTVATNKAAFAFTTTLSCRSCVCLIVSSAHAVEFTHRCANKPWEPAFPFWTKAVQNSSSCEMVVIRSVKMFKHLKEDDRIAAFFNRQQKVLGHSLPLDTYLFKPVQRILRYHLLLQV